MLYLVATPIGNLGDMTLRAIEVLKAVNIIASEDTRNTGRLLKHYGIETSQTPFHEHNKDAAAPRLVARMLQGQDVALVTDAGTPGISDPAFSLVRAALDAGIEVTAIPGATAFVAALVISGLPVHSFCFRGFPPRKSGKRRHFIEADVAIPYTLIYYESPHRLAAFLQDLYAVLGDRRVVLANDLTKMYEQVERGTLAEISASVGERDKLLGEYVVLVEGAEAAEKD